jgi:hypothetical protein
MHVSILPLLPQHIHSTHNFNKTVSIYDLRQEEALQAVKRIRSDAHPPRSDATPEEFAEVVSIIGGRLSFLNKAAKSADMVKMAEHMLKVEKEWLRSQIGLIPDHDDDVGY